MPGVGEAVQEEALGGALMGGETLEDESGERGEVSATEERAQQTFFKRSAWATSEREGP